MGVTIEGWGAGGEGSGVTVVAAAGAKRILACRKTKDGGSCKV